jgi:hypothetical protein
MRALRVSVVTAAAVLTACGGTDGSLGDAGAADSDAAASSSADVDASGTAASDASTEGDGGLCTPDPRDHDACYACLLASCCTELTSCQASSYCNLQFGQMLACRASHLTQCRDSFVNSGDPIATQVGACIDATPCHDSCAE